MSGDQQETIADQVGHVWRQLMAAMTAQGATRADIVNMAFLTAGTIVDLTAQELWGETWMIPPPDIARQEDELGAEYPDLLQARQVAEALEWNK